MAEEFEIKLRDGFSAVAHRIQTASADLRKSLSNIAAPSGADPSLWIAPLKRNLTALKSTVGTVSGSFAGFRGIASGALEAVGRSKFGSQLVSSFQGARAAAGLAGSSLEGFRGVATASIESLGGPLGSLRAKLAESTNLSGLAESFTKWATIGVTAATTVGAAFAGFSAKLADSFRSSSGALETLTGDASLGNRVRAQARELAVPLQEAQAQFIDLANAGIVGPQADEIFARVQDLKAQGIDKSRTDGLVSAIEKIKSDNQFDPGDFKALQGAGVQKTALIDQLAKNLGKSTEEIKQMVAAGQIEGDPAIRAALDVVKAKTGNAQAGDAAKGDLTGTVSGQLQSVKSAFEQAQLDFGGKILDSLAPVFPLVQRLSEWLGGEGGRTFLDGVAESIGATIGFLLDHKDDIMAAFSSIAEGVKGGFAVVSDIFSTLFGGGTDNAGESIRKIGEVLGSVAKFAIPVLAVLAPVAAIISVIGAVVGPVVAVVGGLASVFGTIVTVGGAILTALSAVAGAVIGVVTAIGLAPVLIGAALLGIGALVIKYWDDIKLFFARLGTNFAALITQAAQWGGDIIAGLIEGITSKIGAVKDTLIGAAKAGLAAFKGVLGIASPSRVMGQMGQFTVQGFSGGIDRHSELASASMADMATPPDLAAPSVTVNTPPFPTSAGEPGGGQTGSSRSAPPNIQIIIQGSPDAKATANEVQSALASFAFA